MILLVTVLIGSGLTWFLDASVRKQAKEPEKWIATILLVLGIGLACLTKLKIPITTPADLLIQWIAPWMKHYLTGG